MREEGFVEGQNMLWEPRWADFHGDRLPALAADLVSRKVDVIITAAGYFPALAAKNATSTIPIIFTNVADPVGFGLIASLARPGGNLTGFSFMSVELIPKQLELLSELVPQAGIIALLVNPNVANVERINRIISDVQEAARTKRVSLRSFYPEGCHRKRDRHRFCLARPTPCRRARLCPRHVLL